MNILESIRAKAKEKGARIVLPEGTEERTVKGAAIIAKERIAKVFLVGQEKQIKEVAGKHNVDLTGVEIVEPEKSEKFKKYAENLYEIRKHKGMTLEDAEALTKNPLYFGVLMLQNGDVDGMVAGAENTTGNVLRPALQIIKTEKGISSVSGTFIMIVPNCEYGAEGVFFFADSAVTPSPTAEQMAESAYLTARSAKTLVGFDPKVAMLSFSTKGSAKHESIDKIVQAVEIARERYPELIIDGDLQGDAALVSSVGNSKAPGSPVAGQANVLIFPDLHAGNISYKLVQRLAKAEAIGPILQGIAKPVNDLSRGCSVDDVVNMVAITSLQAK